MKIDYSIFIVYYLYFLISIFFFYFIGGLISFFCGLNFSGNKKTFLFLLTGFFAFTVSFSLFYTKIVGTTNLVLLIFLIYIVYKYRSDFSLTRNRNIISYLVVDFQPFFFKIFLFSSIIFFVNLLLRMDFTSPFFFNASKDEIFYSLVTKFIESKHIESVSIDWFYFNDMVNLRPYHYFEQWINLFFVKLKLPSLHSLFFIVSPIFFTLTAFGIESLFSFEDNRKNIFKLIFVLAICYFGFFAIDLKAEHVVSFSNPIPLGFKYQVLFWFSFIIIFLIRKKMWNWMFASFSLLPLLNFGLFPVLLSMFFLYLICFKYLFKTERSYWVLITMLIVLVGIPVIKQINNNPDFSGQYDQKVSEVIQYYESGQFILKIKLILSMGWFYFIKKMQENAGILLLLLFVNLFFVKTKKTYFTSEDKSIIILLLLVLFSSLFVSAVLNFMLDANQIFNMTFQTVIGVVFIITAIRLVNAIENRRVFYIFIFVLFLFSSYNILNKRKSLNYEIFSNYNLSYRTELVDQFRERYNGRDWNGARFMSKEYYKSIYQIQSTDQFEGFPFAFITDNLHLYTLNPENAVVNSPDPLGIYQFAYDRLSNIEYYNNWAKERGFNVLEKKSGLACQLAFIKEFKIDFIVAQKGVFIPFEIMKLVDKEVVSSVNGERVYFINNKLLPSIP